MQASVLISVVSPIQQKLQFETFVQVIYFSDVYPEKSPQQCLKLCQVLPKYLQS